jgi:hypothetical protein
VPFGDHALQQFVRITINTNYAYVLFDFFQYFRDRTYSKTSVVCMGRNMAFSKDNLSIDNPSPAMVNCPHK